MALATIDQLKEYVGGVDTQNPDKDDALLTRLVDAATDAIENYCGRTFGSTVYTNEVYDGTGTRVLTLRNFPIISVSSVLEAGSSLTTGTAATPSSPDVIIDLVHGQLIRPWFYWLPYRAWYQITYTAGYATVPASIVQACIEVAALMLRNKEHIGISAKTSGTQTVTFVGDIPKPVRDALDGYADVTLGRST